MELKLYFENATVYHLPQVCSDHRPILVLLGDKQAKGHLFHKQSKFQVAWISHDKFSTFIHNHWKREGGINVVVEDIIQNMET